MTDQRSASKASRLEPLGVLWRLFAAPQTLLALMGALALAAVLGTLIPQIPREAAHDPRAWLALQPGVLARGNAFFQALGLFDLYHAFWFRLLLVLAGVALFVWTVESAELAWRATGRRRTASLFGPWQNSPLQLHIPSSHSVPEAEAQLHHLLDEEGYRSAALPPLPDAGWMAGKREPLLWARSLTFAALLAALLGLAVLSGWGWQNADWSPAEGDSRAVGHGTGYTLRLDAFDASGPGNEYQSRLSWLRLDSDRPVQQDVVREGHPARREGVAVRQVGIVQAVRVSGRDKVGRPLRFQPGELSAQPTEEIGVAFESAEVQHVVLIPDEDLFLLFSYKPATGSDRPALQVALLRGAEAEQQPLGALHESGTLSFNGFQIRLDLVPRPILRVDRRPAMAWVLGSLLVAVLALAAGWLVPPRVIRLHVVPGQECPTVAHIVALGGAGERPWLARLAAQVREALTGDP